MHPCDGSVELLGFLDDDPPCTGGSIAGSPVLGPVDDLADHPDAAVVIAVGRPDAYTARRDLVARLALPPERYATLVAPRRERRVELPVGRRDGRAGPGRP